MHALSLQIQSPSQFGQVTLPPQLLPISPHHWPPVGLQEAGVRHIVPLPAVGTVMEPPVELLPPETDAPPAFAPEFPVPPVLAAVPPVLPSVEPPTLGSFVEQAFAAANSTRKASAAPK
jgi:hypothetical protein